MAASKPMITARAAVGRHQSRRIRNRGSLAAAVWPEQAEEFGRANIKRNVVESCPALVAVHDVLHRDDGSSDGFRFSAYFRVCRGLGSHGLVPRRRSGSAS